MKLDKTTLTNILVGKLNTICRTNENNVPSINKVLKMETKVILSVDHNCGLTMDEFDEVLSNLNNFTEVQWERRNHFFSFSGVVSVTILWD